MWTVKHQSEVPQWLAYRENLRQEALAERPEPEPPPMVAMRKLVIARKARKAGWNDDESFRAEIRPGDRVMVEEGFTYEVGGPRTGYFRRYTRWNKGPAWSPEEAEQ